MNANASEVCSPDANGDYVPQKRRGKGRIANIKSQPIRSYHEVHIHIIDKTDNTECEDPVGIVIIHYSEIPRENLAEDDHVSYSKIEKVEGEEYQYEMISAKKLAS
ncbi:MAG: hypothetical protein AAFR61_14205 [Bacteroidota bacterium]